MKVNTYNFQNNWQTQTLDSTKIIIFHILPINHLTIGLQKCEFDFDES